LAEDLKITKGTSRAETYEEIVPQIKALVADELDIVANLANIAAVLKEAFDFFWIGFYFVKGNELVLGPFQGPVACTRIQKGKGVCGESWFDKKVIVVPDVDQFPGHIACSSQSKSEIVLPVFKNGEVHLILDIDSNQADDFSEIDEKYLNEIIQIVEEVIV
jgi:L-methionine (R)-S-oxide reductase